MPSGVYVRTPEIRAKTSATLMGHSVSADTRKKLSDQNMGHPVSPDACEAMSIASRNSDAVKAQHEIMRGVSLSQEHCAAISKGMQESDAVEAERGGNDIVYHHILYDHSDLSKNRVAMTRSNHTMGHNLLRKLGIDIPHINMET